MMKRCRLRDELEKERVFEFGEGFVVEFSGKREILRNAEKINVTWVGTSSLRMPFIFYMQFL